MRRLSQYLALLTVTLFSILSSVSESAAQSPAQGARIIRLDDGLGTGTCIGQQDQVTVTLRRVILEKQSRWLGLIEDRELGVSLVAKVEGSSSDDKRVASFAKAMKQPVNQFGSGQIQLAQEENLLSRFALTNGTNNFSTITLQVGIFRTQGKSVAAQVLTGAIDATKSLALPVNPFVSAYAVATAYVNSVFSPLLSQAASEGEALSAQIVMNISEGTCSSDFERTGTKAILLAAPNPSLAGYVDIGNIDNYCFSSTLRPSFGLKASVKTSGQDCQSGANYFDVQNSHLAFVVNAIRPAKSVPALRSSVVPKSFDVPVPSPISSSAIRDTATVLGGRGVDFRAATELSKAFASKSPDREVAQVFGVTPTYVESYRESILRCESNGINMFKCLSGILE
ncbi:MAG: hypothetical protein J0H39_21695 [Alphaproteobacteria bacterium]|nr:hypothetical protein [Alphaproteobacteria bacterium]